MQALRAGPQGGTAGCLGG